MIAVPQRAKRVAQMPEPIIDYRQPRAALADHVSFFYHFRHDGAGFSAVNRAEFAQLRFIMAGENGQCRFVDGTVQAIPAICVQGPTTGNTQISGSGRIDVIGLGLMPEGWAALVPMDASAAANRLFDAVDLLGPKVLTARDALVAAPDFDARVAVLEDLLEYLMAQRPSDSIGEFHGFVHKVNQWLADGAAPQISDLLARTGLSLAQVERRCKRYFGSPPKLLARKYRALRTAIAITHGDAELDDILAEGYFDQSHLIREMRHFTGMTPAAFAAQPTMFNMLIAKRIELERSRPIERHSLIT